MARSQARLSTEAPVAISLRRDLSGCFLVLHVLLRSRACAIYGLGLSVRPVQQAARSFALLPCCLFPCGDRSIRRPLRPMSQTRTEGGFKHDNLTQPGHN